MRSRVAAWLAAHPGPHTCREIADGLDLPDDDERRTHKVAIAARGLWMQGRLVRESRKYAAATVAAPQ